MLVPVETSERRISEKGTVFELRIVVADLVKVVVVKPAVKGLNKIGDECSFTKRFWETLDLVDESNKFSE